MNINIYQELLNCQQSFKYFVTNYIKVYDPKKGLVLLEFYPFQEKLIDLYENERFVLTAKFRQGGFSTITVLYGLWKCMFFPDQLFFFACRTDAEAKHLAGILNRVFSSFPDWLLPRLDTETAYVKSFYLTKSKMIFGTMNETRGKTINYLVIDEAAFFPDMNEQWKSAWPAICNGGKAFVLSTTNGLGNWFYETYADAEKGLNKFKVYFCNYKEHPCYQDEEFCKELRQRLGEKGWEQEILCNFCADYEETNFEDFTNKALASELFGIKRKKGFSKEEKSLFTEIITRLSKPVK
jgi:hypothetical protein